MSDQKDVTLARDLFENVEEIEKELTDFLTGYIHYLRQTQSAAAAAG